MGNNREKEMKREDEIKDKFGTSGGWTLPENYFEGFYEEMSAKLPAYPEKPRVAPMSMWQRMKPYVYLAAMFAGIWVMMKVFYNVTSDASLQVDNPPQHIAMAMQEITSSDSYIELNNYNYSSSESDEEIIYEYADISELEKEFGFELEPEYKRINIEEMTSGD